MPDTLILLFHPDLTHSRANQALAKAATTVPGVEIIDMASEYPDGIIDADREVARVLAAGRIVLQFPVHWYSTPPLLQAWQDAVLTRMYYMAHETEGRLLEGTPLMMAATAGNVPKNYTPDGAALFPLLDLLRPLRATANRCRLPWGEPFVLYSASRMDDTALEEAGKRYAEALAHWISSTPAHALAQTAA